MLWLELCMLKINSGGHLRGKTWRCCRVWPVSLVKLCAIMSCTRAFFIAGLKLKFDQKMSWNRYHSLKHSVDVHVRVAAATQDLLRCDDMKSVLETGGFSCFITHTHFIPHNPHPTRTLPSQVHSSPKASSAPFHPVPSCSTSKTTRCCTPHPWLAAKD